MSQHSIGQTPRFAMPMHRPLSIVCCCFVDSYIHVYFFEVIPTYLGLIFDVAWTDISAVFIDSLGSHRDLDTVCRPLDRGVYECVPSVWFTTVHCVDKKVRRAVLICVLGPGVLCVVTQRCCPKRLQTIYQLIAKRIRELSTMHGLTIFAAKPGLFLLSSPTNVREKLFQIAFFGLSWCPVCLVIYTDSSKEYQPTIWPQDLVHLRLLLTRCDSQQVVMFAAFPPSCVCTPAITLHVLIFHTGIPTRCHADSDSHYHRSRIKATENPQAFCVLYWCARSLFPPRHIVVRAIVAVLSSLFYSTVSKLCTGK